jgi:uncharacterized protein YqjF (DUF2071 family)
MNLMNTVEGRIERRLLVNMRVDPDAVSRVLPDPFRALIVDGWSIAGMCLIRLTGLRPAGLPSRLGLTTENVAHRIAVEWDDQGERRTGVWIPQRHTASRLTVALGGRAFPAVHSFARFDVDDRGDEISINVTRDHRPFISVSAAAAADVPDSSVFSSMDEANAFFQTGSTGVSPAGRNERCDMVDLDVDGWNLRPLRIMEAHSTILEDLWPNGTSSEWDSAFIMRDMKCRWSSPNDRRSVVEAALAGR